MTLPGGSHDEAIAMACISYLSERFLYEKGLFRSQASLTDVRLLHTKMAQGDVNIVRSEPDPHIVTGLLQKTLKDMSPAAFGGVYDDILATEISEDSGHSCTSVRTWLVKLPKERFDLISALFALLQRIAAVGGNESNAVQLAYYIAPFVCRRDNSAYMSIRHMEDLRKIRPVVAFVVENHDVVFRGLKPVPQMQPSTHMHADSALHGPPGAAGTGARAGLGLDGHVAQVRGPGHAGPNGGAGGGAAGGLASSSSDSMEDLRGPGRPAANKLSLPRLLTGQQHLSSSSSPRGVESPLGGEGFFYPGEGEYSYNAHAGTYGGPYGVEETGAQAPAAINFNGWEWKIFQSLVHAKVGSFLSGVRSDDDYDAFVDVATDNGDAMQDDGPAWSGAGRARRKSVPAGRGRRTGGAAGSDYGGALGDSDGDPAASYESMVCDPSDNGSAGSNNHMNISGSGGGGDGGGGAGDGTAWPRPSGGAGRPAKRHDDGSHSGAGGGGGGSGSRARGERRRMVAECKTLRYQISNFEADWNKTHNRLPKGSERGAMQQVYTRYRDMKKEIRDNAACDIQRVARGYLLRARLAKFAVVLPFSPSRHRGGAGGGPTPASPTAARQQAAIPPELFAKYKSLLTQKRDLKKELKMFDDQFVGTHGRAPRKSDKEVMRPLYQQYHEVKAELDALQAALEAAHGPLSLSLLGASAAGGGGGAWGHSGPGSVASAMSAVSSVGTTTVVTSAMAVHEEEMPPAPSASTAQRDRDVAHHTRLDATANSLSSTSSTLGGVGLGLGLSSSGSSSSGSGGLYAAPAGGRVSAAGDLLGARASPSLSLLQPSSGGFGGPVRLEDLDLDALQEEKKTLHAYLKAYERDFSRMHNRPVMRHEDIQPVASEYQRYKDLKALVKERKGSVTA